jgi:uncharacterized protein YuzE
MKIKYDQEVDALHIRVQENFVAMTKEVAEGVNLDLDHEGKLLGLEILNATERYSPSDFFNFTTEKSHFGSG